MALWSWSSVGVTNDLDERVSSNLSFINVMSELVFEVNDVNDYQIQFNDMVIETFERL